MTGKLFVLAHDQARRGAAAFAMTAPDGWMCKFSEPTRTLSQNSAQWPYIDAFSKQLEWPVNGKMCKLEPEEFKDILTAAFRGDAVRLAAGLNGGVVMLGMRTSKMKKAEFSEYLEFLKATAALRGVTVYAEQP